MTQETRLLRRVITRLAIIGFEGDASEISEIVGMAPTRVCRRGEPVTPGASNVRNENEWHLQSPTAPENATPEESVRDLLRLIPGPQAFKRLPAGCATQVTCVIYTYNERPGFFLPAELVSQLAEIGADIDVDTYDLTSSEDE